MRISTLLVLAAALALGACQSPAPTPSGNTLETPPTPATPAAPATPTTPATPATPATSAVPTGADDTCGAATYAWLIGEDRAKIPATPPGKTVRVLCSTCPMTMDFHAGRVNIIFDQKSGVVGKISCG